MSIFNFLTGEFIDVISWVDDTRDTMVWRFERQGHAIKYGAKLTVREGQSAVFIHEGQLADVVRSPRYATVLGLLLEAKKQYLRGHVVTRQDGSVKAIWTRMKEWFLGNF